MVAARWGGRILFWAVRWPTVWPDGQSCPLVLLWTATGNRSSLERYFMVAIILGGLVSAVKNSRTLIKVAAIVGGQILIIMDYCRATSSSRGKGLLVATIMGGQVAVFLDSQVAGRDGQADAMEGR